MAASTWTPGKIIFVVLVSLFGLGVICCGGIWLVYGSKVMSIYRITTNAQALQDAVKRDIAPDAELGFESQGEKKLVLVVGVSDELTDERVRELQDKLFTMYVEKFRQHGGLPLFGVGVGKAVPPEGEKPGSVTDWSGHVAAVADLEQRTGATAPPIDAFLKELLEKNGKLTMGDGKVEVRVGTDVKAEPGKKDESSGEPPPK